MSTLKEDDASPPVCKNRLILPQFASNFEILKGQFWVPLQ